MLLLKCTPKEASDGQFSPESTVEDVSTLDFEPIHPLTGPVYVEGAEVGDVLAVTLHEIEIGEFGWSAVIPGFGFLADEFTEPFLHTYTFEEGQTYATLPSGARIELAPFPGVIGGCSCDRLSPVHDPTPYERWQYG